MSLTLGTPELIASRAFDVSLGAAPSANAEPAESDTPGLSAVFTGDGQALVLVKPDEERAERIKEQNAPSAEQLQAIREALRGGSPLEQVLNALAAAVRNDPASAGPLTMAALQVFVEISGSTNTQAAFQAMLATAMNAIPANFDGALSSALDLIALGLSSEGTNGTQQALGADLFALAVDRFGGGDAASFAVALGLELLSNDLATVAPASAALLEAAAAGELDSESDNLFGIFGGDQGAINQGAILPSPSGGGGGGEGASGTQPNNETDGDDDGDTTPQSNPTPTPVNPAS